MTETARKAPKKGGSGSTDQINLARLFRITKRFTSINVFISRFTFYYKKTLEIKTVGGNINFKGGHLS
ncbi:hypothetical protein G8770_07525 [Aestuariicella hydrocarbonica]|uniref:Uncharacterized protein n=1 Tax=Pseudomaricurvus hydrocarbonicus TaxID=1470433 RepID=A0A9E5JRJ0_9GAMM|nr:hypothetical protein [Aestuariicella hydrocarbonica]NHO65388.1 hypothetical protein [Aestuariicella hydrocarbonica]